MSKPKSKPKKPETEAELVKRAIKVLRKLPDTEAMKIHGDMYQESGIPDVLVCMEGFFIAFEFKRPGKEKNVSKYQALKLERIRQAGGEAHIVSSVERAVEIVEGVRNRGI